MRTLRSPDGALRAVTPVFGGLWRNPGTAVPLGEAHPHCAALHAGYEVDDDVRHSGCTARLAALSTALTEAVATSASMPTPNTVRPSGAVHST